MSRRWTSQPPALEGARAASFATHSDTVHCAVPWRVGYPVSGSARTSAAHAPLMADTNSRVLAWSGCWGAACSSLDNGLRKGERNIRLSVGLHKREKRARYIHGIFDVDRTSRTGGPRARNRHKENGANDTVKPTSRGLCGAGLLGARWSSGVWSLKSPVSAAAASIAEKRGIRHISTLGPRSRLTHAGRGSRGEQAKGGGGQEAAEAARHCAQ
jgi:hypothetical protein